MFRRWLSGFWRDYKEKIMQIAKVFGILIAIGASAGVIFSTLNLNNGNESNTVSKVYVPEKTVISGDDITEEEYEKESNLAEIFVNFCNEQKIEEAYNLLTDECKEKMYPTMEKFKENYYSKIFTEKKEYNLQSWISEQNYNIYRIRYLSDLLATGNYEEVDKTDDYITIVSSGEQKKLNLNGYVKTVGLNKITKTNEIESEIKSVDIYMDYVIYDIKIKNLTEKEILLDPLENIYTLKLIGTNGASYKLDDTNLKSIDLKIMSGGEKYIKLKFVKQYGSGINGSKIEFSKAVLDYRKYSEDKNNYEGFVKIHINL